MELLGWSGSLYVNWKAEYPAIGDAVPENLTTSLESRAVHDLPGRLLHTSVTTALSVDSRHFVGAKFQRSQYYIHLLSASDTVRTLPKYYRTYRLVVVVNVYLRVLLSCLSDVHKSSNIFTTT